MQKQVCVGSYEKDGLELSLSLTLQYFVPGKFVLKCCELTVLVVAPRLCYIQY